jgi:hypothetical protein
MIDVDGITGAGPIWHRLTEFAIQQGYVSATVPNIGTGNMPGGGMVQTSKCLNKDCSRSELIYAEPDRVWYSDLESGHYCLEDFYIQNIKPAEITKVAQLFDFEDFTIEWCGGERSVGSVRTVGIVGLDPKDPNNPSLPNDLTILKPTPNETFYIRQDIPLELQQIILKANQSVDWYQNDVMVGSGENIFIQPVLGEYEIMAVYFGKTESVKIFVRSIE